MSLFVRDFDGNTILTCVDVRHDAAFLTRVDVRSVNGPLVSEWCTKLVLVTKYPTRTYTDGGNIGVF